MKHIVDHIVRDIVDETYNNVRRVIFISFKLFCINYELLNVYFLEQKILLNISEF